MQLMTSIAYKYHQANDKLFLFEKICFIFKYIYIKNYVKDYLDDFNLTIMVLRSIVVNAHAIW